MSISTKFKSALAHAIRGLGLLIALVLAFWLTLTLVYCIPEQAFRPYGVESAEIVINEGKYPDSVTEGRLGIDNFTVAWMLNIAVNAEGNPFVASLEDAYVGPAEGGPIGRLQSWVDDPDGTERGTYSRYWHGYLVYLKPLLVFFGIRQIRFLFQIGFVLLVFAAVTSLVRKFKDRGVFAAMALVFSYAIMHGFDAVMVLPMFPSFVISVIGVLWMIRVREDRWRICRGFLVIGAFTVFLDMLDNPILTLGVPLCTFVFRFAGRKPTKWILKTIVCSALSWAVAYGFVWAMKWVLATLVTGQDVLGRALEQADYRMGGGDQGDYNHFTVILKGYAKNLIIREHILPVILGLMLVFLVVLATCIALKRKGRLEGKGLWGGIGLYALVGALPYLWILVFGNHSAEHSFFTYRNQIITVFALLLGIQWVASFIPADSLPWNKKGFRRHTS